MKDLPRSIPQIKTSYTHTKTYYIGRVEIKTVTQIKDLGILFENTPSFKAHVQSITLKIGMLRGIGLHPAKEMGSRIIFIKIIVTFINPIIEYGAIIWAKNNIGDERALEIILHHGI